MKKKPGIEIILGLGKPKGKPEPESDVEGYDEEHKVMAEEMIDAIKAGDAAALVEAFKGLFHACEMQPHDEYEE